MAVESLRIAHSAATIAGLQSGRERCDGGHAFGPHIRREWLIHYVKSGRGRLYMNGNTYPVGPGEVFFIPPHIRACYEADRDDPWDYQWIGMWGDGLDTAFAAAGLTEQTPVRAVGLSVAQCLDRLQKRPPNDGTFGFIAEGYAFLEALTADRKAAISGGEYVLRAEEYMEHFLHTPLTVADIADYLHINRSYLTALFKKHRGYSTLQAIQQRRMDAAKAYLVDTDYDITQIARSVGYDNVFVFSHAFKHRFGQSPTAYRQNQK